MHLKTCPNHRVPKHLLTTSISPCPHKVEVTGGIVVRKVPSKLWNARLVVVTVLGVELHIAVTV